MGRLWAPVPTPCWVRVWCINCIGFTARSVACSFLACGVAAGARSAARRTVRENREFYP